MSSLATYPRRVFSILQVRQLSLVLVLLLLTTSNGLAQSTNGTLRVEVVDSLGQTVPNARVTITNVATQQKREQQTGREGVTIFADLAPGNYTISADADGFARGVGEEVVVKSGITATGKIELKVESKIESKMLAIKTVDALIAIREEPGDPLNDLPNLNNDSSALLRVVPGAVAGSAAALGRIVIDGRGKEQQTFLLDKSDITPLTDLPAGDPLLGVLDTLLKPNVALDQNLTDTFAGALTFKPGKFDDKLPTYDVSPFYGPGTGSLINGASLPGFYLGEGKWTFVFYDAFRHDSLNARNFFDHEGKNGLRRNLFGVKLGVPINNKLFTFFAYDGIRGRVERPVYEAVPTDVQCNCAQGPLARVMGLFLPQGTTLVPGTSLNTDFITARRLGRSTSDSDSFDARFDVASTSLSPGIKMDNLFVRFTDQTARFVVPEGVTGRTQRQNLNLVSGVVGLTLLTGNVIHQFRFGVNQNRSGIDIDSPYSTFPELSQSLVTVGSSIPVANLPGQLPNISNTIPTASVGGLSRTVGRGFEQNPTSFNVSYDLTTLIERHDLDLGFEARFVDFSFDKFGGLTYAFPDVPGLRTGVAATINFLSDLSGPAPFSTKVGPRRVKQRNYLSYAQFTARPSPNLKLRFGLRYDYFGAIKERDDRVVIIDPATGLILPPATSFFEPDKLNFQPRFGFEYKTANHIVIRAGAGVYSGLPRLGDFLLPIESDRFNTGITNRPFPFASSDIVRDFNTNPETRQLQPLSFSRDFKSPEKVYRWDAMVTRTFADTFDLNVIYSGNIARRLPVAGVSNQIVSVQTNPDPTQPAIVVRQFDNVRNGEVFKPLGELLFRSSEGESSFNGMTIQFRRNRLKMPSGKTWLDWRNFRSLNVQYTLSRNAGNASGAVVSVPNDFEADRGFNAADARHTFSFSSSYRFWNDKERPQNGRWGWTVGTTISARSGLPLLIRQERPDIVYLDSVGNVFTGPAIGRTAVINTPGGGATGGARVPDLLPGVDPFAHVGILYLNPAAFAIPKPGTFGNLKRGQLRGPATVQADLAVTRTLFRSKYGENDSLLSELKIEIFNLFNRRNFANPLGILPNVLGTSVTGDRIQPGVAFNRLAAGTFGVINAADPGRTLQFTVSFRFNDGY